MLPQGDRRRMWLTGSPSTWLVTPLLQCHSAKAFRWRASQRCWGIPTSRPRRSMPASPARRSSTIWSKRVSSISSTKPWASKPILSPSNYAMMVCMRQANSPFEYQTEGILLHEVQRRWRVLLGAEIHQIGLHPFGWRSRGTQYLPSPSPPPQSSGASM